MKWRYCFLVVQILNDFEPCWRLARALQQQSTSSVLTFEYLSAEFAEHHEQLLATSAPAFNHSRQRDRGLSSSNVEKSLSTSLPHLDILILPLGLLSSHLHLLRLLRLCLLSPLSLAIPSSRLRSFLQVRPIPSHVLGRRFSRQVPGHSSWHLLPLTWDGTSGQIRCWPAASHPPASEDPIHSRSEGRRRMHWAVGSWCYADGAKSWYECGGGWAWKISCGG